MKLYSSIPSINLPPGKVDENDPIEINVIDLITKGNFQVFPSLDELNEFMNNNSRYSSGDYTLFRFSVDMTIEHMNIITAWALGDKMSNSQFKIKIYETWKKFK